MKGSLRTVRNSRPSDPPKTNFNDWSDPKYKLPHKNVKKHTSEESLEPELTENSSNSSASNTSLELNDIRNKIRKGHPLLSKKEIRNFRLPFYESLLLNLKDDGFLLTHEFIKDLIAVDDVFHKDLETDFSFKKRPILKFTQSVLISLSNGLMKAESCKLSDKKTQEATAFLDLAMLFSQSDDQSWYWIAREMFEQCMEVVDSLDKPADHQLKAMSKYLYASFLFNKLHNLTDAKTLTEFSMSISESKYWTVSDTKEKKGRTLYIESCDLLHKIFLEMAQNEMIGQNTEEAIQLCRNSLLWAKVINCKSAEADSLFRLINIYLSVQQLFSVPDLLENYIKLCTELEDFRGLCEGYILCARYHDSVGEKGYVINDMKKLLQTAKENHIIDMEAMAHHKLATYCLMRGKGEDLLEHAIEAYMCYLNFKKTNKEIEEARCLVGVAQALDVMTDYCNLVNEAENSNLIDLPILFRWKNLRIPFFEKKFVLIPEIYANTDLLDKMENKKYEEYLADTHRRQSALSSLSTKRTSTVISTSVRTVTHSTKISPTFRTRSFSIPASYTSNKSDETKPRSVSIRLHDYNDDRSASIMENQ